MKYTILLLAFLSFTLTTGCATKLDGQTYSRDQARKIQNIRYGTIKDMVSVVLDGTNSPVGTISGAVIGGIAGSSIGQGNGSAILSVLGAVLGGMAGSAVEKDVTKAKATEFTIQLERSGRDIIIVQENSEQAIFRVGDRVRIVSVDGESRISLVNKN